MEHFKTRQQDRIPFPQKIVYGLGAFVNNLLAAAIGGMIIVLNLGLGMNPALVGLLGPGSNAHGPNEFLHIPTGKKLTCCVAQVLLDHNRVGA